MILFFSSSEKRPSSPVQQQPQEGNKRGVSTEVLKHPDASAAKGSTSGSWWWSVVPSITYPPQPVKTPVTWSKCLAPKGILPVHKHTHLNAHNTITTAVTMGLTHVGRPKQQSIENLLSASLHLALSGTLQRRLINEKCLDSKLESHWHLFTPE